MLLRARLEAGLTQEQVATRLQAAGESASPSSVSRSEGGEGVRTIEKATREARARGYSLSFVLTPTTTPPNAGTPSREDTLRELLAQLHVVTRALKDWERGGDDEQG